MTEDKNDKGMGGVGAKSTKTCPKCGAKDVVLVPGRVGPFGTGNNIWMGVCIFSAVKVSRYVCGQCGFVEEWIDKKEDIEKIKRKH